MTQINGEEVVCPKMDCQCDDVYSTHGGLIYVCGLCGHAWTSLKYDDLQADILADLEP